MIDLIAYVRNHPKLGSTNSDICDSCKEFWLEASMEIYEKNILKDIEELGRVVCKITLQKYTWLWIDLSDILVLIVYLGMHQILLDDPTGSKEKCRKLPVG